MFETGSHIFNACSLDEFFCILFTNKWALFNPYQEENKLLINEMSLPVLYTTVLYSMTMHNLTCTPFWLRPVVWLISMDTNKVPTISYYKRIKKDVTIRIQCITCGTFIIKSINSIIDVENFQNDNILAQGTQKTQLNGDRRWSLYSFLNRCYCFRFLNCPLFITLNIEISGSKNTLKIWVILLSMKTLEQNIKWRWTFVKVYIITKIYRL